MDKYLVMRLIEEAIWQEQRNNQKLAKLLTEAAKEIENARKGHVRNPADQSAEPGRDEEL